MMKNFFWAVGVSALMLSGCSGEESTETQDTADTDTTGTQDSTQGTDGTSSTDGTSGGTDGTDGTDGSNTCDPRPFEAAGSSAEYAAQYQYYRMVVTKGDAAPYDMIMVESFGDPQFAGPTTTGTYEIADVGYEACGLCVLGFTDCTDAADPMTCAKTYYARGGTVEFTEMGAVGANIGVNLTEVMLAESTIDWGGSWESTTIAGGDVWCADGHTFTAEVAEANLGGSGGPQVVEPAVAEPECVTAGNGTGLGNNIANFELQNCNGDMVSLHSGCGTDKLVWFVHTTGWCPACSEWIPEVHRRQQEAGGIEAGFNVKYVLGEDNDGGVPTAEFCTQYATNLGVSPADVLIDNTSGAWSTFVANINNYDSAFIPWNAVLRGSNMEYIWSDTANDGTTASVEAAVELLMSE